MRLPFNGSYPITQIFGANHDYYYKNFGMQGHNGIDYGLPTGTPVLAATDGIVHTLQDDPGFGHYIELIGSSYKTIYAHLQSFSVTNNTAVKAGQQIGISNNSGNSSGPHLHFGVKPIPQDNNNGYFGAIDPQPILNQGEQPVKEIATADQVKSVIVEALERPGTDAEVKGLTGKLLWDEVIVPINAGPERAAIKKKHADDAANANGQFEQVTVYRKVK